MWASHGGHELGTEGSAAKATAVLAVGACSVWGSIQASRPNPTGAVGIEAIITDKPVLNVAGRSPIGEVITAAVVWGLYEVGCKGPDTFSPCPMVQWNLCTSWPIGSGHPRIGRTERDFFDKCTPFCNALPDVRVPGIGVETTAKTAGLALLSATAGGVAVHGAATSTSRWMQRWGDRRGEPLSAFGDLESVWLPMPGMRDASWQPRRCRC